MNGDSLRAPGLTVRCQIRYNNIHERSSAWSAITYGSASGVSVDKIVSTYLALHLDTTPGTLGAHRAVRAWLQAQLDRNNDPGRSRVSQWLLGEALDAMVSPALRVAYGRWLDTMLSKPHRWPRHRKRRSA